MTNSDRELGAELLALLTEFTKSEEYAEYKQAVKASSMGMGFGGIFGQNDDLVEALIRWLTPNVKGGA